MHIFFKLLLIIPLIEILGFIFIGGAIGFGASFLWLVGAGILGSYILRRQGGIWSRVQTADDDLFVVEGLFDAVTLLLAGILLVFPGFISDILALPLLAPQIRHLIFGRMKKNPDGFIRRHARFNGESRHGGRDDTPDVIDAEYTEVSSDTPPAGGHNNPAGQLPRD